MPRFYKGAAHGSHWAKINAKKLGFQAVSTKDPAVSDEEVKISLNEIVGHIAHGPLISKSSYLSITKSYGVAWDYTKGNGYIYTIDITDDILIDPVKHRRLGDKGVLAKGSLSTSGESSVAPSFHR